MAPITTPHRKVTGQLDDLPPLLIGGAVFNQQFNDNPEQLPVEQILRIAFGNGLNAIDTSPYYGPSEILLGDCLKKLHDEYPRDEYYIVTKCGRIQLDEFDYSPAWIRKSIERSLERLGTTYLDLVYLHDIEFVDEAGILEALKELKRLKQEGLIHHFGISGYPVDFLYEIALKCSTIEEIGPLDAVLSYSNFNLQNERLRPYIDKFLNECKVQKVLCASILSMSLLRSAPTHAFHPASQELKDKCQQVAELTASRGVELADLATRYAIREFPGPVVLGVSTVEELQDAIVSYWNVINSSVDDEQLVKEVKGALGSHLNEVWPSGKH